MVYGRMVSEALAIAKAVLISCGATRSLKEAIEVLEDYMSGLVSEEMLEEAIVLLLEAAAEAKLMGCLDWYRIEEAAAILEQALGEPHGG